MDFNEWVRFGRERNWCGNAVCYTHDGLPLTKTEDDEFNEGLDPCVHVIRLYESKEVRDAVEDNHAPSVWRNAERESL